MPATLDLSNRFLVGRLADGSGRVRLMAAPPPSKALTPDEALVLAAWLVHVADASVVRFAEILEAVESEAAA